ncbi:hypothetical protein BS78_07G122200 [Paspalum vaginatum]|nr:hypothetical protein BS78_07G122200 [Paspalum vaginatum]
MRVDSPGYLFGLLVLPWWFPVVLCVYFLLKGDGESFFIRRGLPYTFGVLLRLILGALLMVAFKSKSLHWPFLADGGSFSSVPSIQPVIAVGVGGQAWGVDVQELCAVIFFSVFKFLCSACMMFVCLTV